MNLRTALTFRGKLMLAMMLIVLVVMGTTLYLTERSVQVRYQEALDTRFQTQMLLFTQAQEAQLQAVTEKCRSLSNSVRMRAALEEKDGDDLYRNALTELQGIFSPQPVSHEQKDQAVPRASFFRFLDAEGAVMSPAGHPAGLIGQDSLDQSLASMGRILRDIEKQTVGYIALTRGNEQSALRQVVLTKILDWDGRNLGGLVLGFPVRSLVTPDASEDEATRSGIWLSGRLYIEGLNAVDRRFVADRFAQAMRREAAGQFPITLEGGPHLLFYKAIDPQTQLAPAYEISLYPLAGALREQESLRWKIAGFGLLVLLAGFVASHFISKGLSDPVDKIVAGSEENLSLRRKAEHSLLEVNQELERTLAELRATQHQVIQQERLSALGQMASGIAHDFNNSLTPILGFSDLLLQRPALLDNKEETRRYLSFLRTSAQDAANVVKRLREFYRPLEKDDKFSPLDLNAIARQIVLLTEPKWRGQSQARGATVYVETNLQTLPVIRADESALREVLTNLIFNAVDAMPEGGVITLETLAENGEAVLMVRDTGVGMPEAVRKRCLEPFFSTKGENGTGLGLSMVYGIVERHGGRLEIDSAPGKGTTFTIRLPAGVATAADEIIAPDAPPLASLKVLVVDDEPRVREVISAYLRSDGHGVTTASSAREGLEQFHAQPFDVVVTDRAMPEMSGDQMAGLIKQVRPQTPIVLLTGFGTMMEATDEKLKDIDVVLSKPVTLVALRKTIEELLRAA